ncbi:MAG: L-seryl-tRNA(Sec) selenium transferase [Dehalococcoidales bacterium]|nr:MAG: L-seryl-tRNA(Sec) selenium transferase [Dehalococcoidales bacterium]
MMENEFRRLPGVDTVISDERIVRLTARYPHDLLVNLVREQLEKARELISSGNPCPSLDDIVQSVSAQLDRLENPVLRPVINATGVVIHTNLGRAPLSKETIAAMDTVSRDYSNLEFDLPTGKRGSRYVHIEDLLCRLSGAESGMVVNNNASAVLLALSATARRREVIVSRGEAVEIGGSFRIPDVMRQSGAKLVEVGTTNRTYINDFRDAVTPSTAALMRVHSSNFQVIGFTHTVTIEELAELGKQVGLPVLDDLGSGCFLDTSDYGLAPEPMVQQSIACGVGLACFSGDKLLGGPQAGIIVGKKKLMDKLKKHPLARAVRTDKTRIAGLSATLLHYLRGEAVEKIPIWRMIAASPEEIGSRAIAWAEAFGKQAEVIDGESMVGGGSLPGSTLPTRLVAIGRKGSMSAAGVQALARKLRNSKEMPVIGRINEDVLLLDPRSVLPEDDEILINILRTIAAEL